MKKTILTIALITVIGSHIAAQPTNDSIRKKLNEFLISTGDAYFPEFDEYNLYIRDLLADGKLVGRIDTVKVGIYGFRSNTIPAITHIVMKHGDKMDFLNMSGSYNHHKFKNVILDVFQYFESEENKDISKKLLPLYILGVTQVWIRNMNQPPY